MSTFEAPIKDESQNSLRLLDEAEVCQVVNVPVMWFRSNRRRHLIPYHKLGHRLYRYDPVAVRKALDRLIVKEVK